jgi:uncharacterized protein
MMIFDPHCHMVTRTTDDYERMALCGIAAVVEPSFWLGQPRRRAGTFFDYFDQLCGFERKRAGNHLIEHRAAIALNPREANDRELAAEVLREIPRWLDNPSVVAVGEIGFDDITDAEEDAVRAQFQMARAAGLPVIVHLPHVRKLDGLRRTLKVIRELKFPAELVDLDHNTEETIEEALASGCWCGHTIYPVTKLSPERAVSILEKHGTDRMLLNSSCDWGPSDPLSVPRAVLEMRRRGFAPERIRKVVWENPLAFYRPSGRMPEALR